MDEKDGKTRRLKAPFRTIALALTAGLFLMEFLKSPVVRAILPGFALAAALSVVVVYVDHRTNGGATARARLEAQRVIRVVMTDCVHSKV